MYIFDPLSLLILMYQQERKWNHSQRLHITSDRKRNTGLYYVFVEFLPILDLTSF